MPSSPSALPDFPIDRPFAHRGLHGQGLAENGLAAFAAAIDGGYGIECDVRASADGVPMVFHDATLDRMTDRTGPVSAHDAEALSAFRLAGSEEGVPSLAAMLGLVAGRVPILIEVKRQPGIKRLARAVAALLDAYSGPAAVMSFDPRVPRWFWRYCTHRPRGLVLSAQDQRGWRGAWARRLAVGWAHPHFLACDVRDLPSALSIDARVWGRPVLSWTIRGAADRETAAAHADQIIFERQA